MLTVQIDEHEARELYLEKVDERIKEFDADFIFWDSKELKRRTCLSWNTIQKEFFFEPNFPKFKVGGKWMFPAKETREFLVKWLKEKR